MSGLQKFGLKNYLARTKQVELEVSTLARVMSEHTGQVELITSKGHFTGVTGKTFRSKHKPQNWPKVGDWVTFESVDKATVKVLSVLPRFSTLERLKPIGHDRSGELPVQVLATNIDILLLVLSIEDLPTKSKLKALLKLAKSVPEIYIVLNKTDLVTAKEVTEATKLFSEFVSPGHILPCSAELGAGLSAIQNLLSKEKTVALIGPSGSGKSSLTNVFMGHSAQKTGLVQASNKKGRHTTTHRELFLLPSGALLIDTPGLRDAAEAKASTTRTKVLESRQTRLFKKRKAKLLEKDLEDYTSKRY